MEWFKKWWKKPGSKPERRGDASPIESNPSSPPAAAGNSRPSVQVQTELSREEQIDEIRVIIDTEIAAGFRTVEEIQQWLVESMEGQFTLGLEGNVLVEQLLEEGLHRHAREQLSWPAVTDCDRLDSAFREIEGNGIVARQNFTCCQTCGHAEIGGELDEFEKGGKHAQGYTFYHIQDTERAVEGSGLYLAYGTFDKDPAGGLSIAKAIALALRKQGLEVLWDEDLSKRILVKLDWKRRRSGGEVGIS